MIIRKVWNSMWIQVGNVGKSEIELRYKQVVRKE